MDSPTKQLTQEEDKLVKAYLEQRKRQKAYMKTYNAQPGVAERRKAASARRRAKVKAALKKARELKLI